MRIDVKGVFVISLAAVLLFVLAGCGGSPAAPPSVEPEEAPPTPHPVAPVVISLPPLTSNEEAYIYTINEHINRFNEAWRSYLGCFTNENRDEWDALVSFHLPKIQALCDEGKAIEHPDSAAYIHSEYVTAMKLSEDAALMVAEAFNTNSQYRLDQGLGKRRTCYRLMHEVYELLNQFVEAHSVESPDVAAQITAEQLSEQYKMNEIAADQKYGGKILEVTGTVSSIGKDTAGAPYVVLAGDIYCSFLGAYEPEIAKLTQGQAIKVVGNCKGLHSVLGIVLEID